MKKNSHLVYSTKNGRIKAKAERETLIHEDGDGIVRLFRENRKGSGVTLIKGLPRSTDVKNLAKTLKKKFGVGGSIKEGVIELQTDRREALKEQLEKIGLNVKIAGG